MLVEMCTISPGCNDEVATGSAVKQADAPDPPAGSASAASATAGAAVEVNPDAEFS